MLEPSIDAAATLHARQRKILPVISQAGHEGPHRSAEGRSAAHRAERSILGAEEAANLSEIPNIATKPSS